MADFTFNRALLLAFISVVTKRQRICWVDWLSRRHTCLSSVSFDLNCFFSVWLNLILMKLAVSDIPSQLSWHSLSNGGLVVPRTS